MTGHAFVQKVAVK